jgi:hypothetical protein
MNRFNLISHRNSPVWEARFTGQIFIRRYPRPQGVVKDYLPLLFNGFGVEQRSPDSSINGQYRDY